VGREISVQFSGTVGAPHETRREADRCKSSTRTVDSIIIGITTVETGELATHVESESIIEHDGITKGGFLRGGEVDGLRARSVEGDASCGPISTRERHGTLGILNAHRKLAIRRVHIGVGQP